MLTRRGIATLELVLIFPLLMMLVAGIFLMARADKSRTMAATQARNDAWMKRPQAGPGNSLQIRNDPAASEVSATANVPVSPGSLFPNAGFQATTSATVTANTWDSRVVPFAPGRPALDPHRDELGLIAKSVPVVGPIINGGLVAFAWTMNPQRNIPLVIAAQVGSFANGLVQVAGWTLENVASPALGAAITSLQGLMFPLYPIAWFSKSARNTIKRYNSIINMMQTAQSQIFHNLYEASRGRPGNWNPELFLWLKGFKP